MRFEFIKEHSNRFCVEKMAKILGVSRSGYYKFRKRGAGKRKIREAELVEKIRFLHKKSRKIYGSPKIHQELKKNGEKCSRKRVARLMKKEGIRSEIRKKWRKTIKGDSKGEPAPNLVNKNFLVNRPNRVWVSDITYIETVEGWLYVAVVLDLFSRKVVGLGMGDSLDTDLIIRALRQAICHRKFKGELIHHSDRGSQYTSKIFVDFAKKNHITLSMSAKGDCYDNAVAESFFHTLKSEHTNHKLFRTRAEGMLSVFEYIEAFYNRERSHSFLGYLSPVEYEERGWNGNKLVKETA